MAIEEGVDLGKFDAPPVGDAVAPFRENPYEKEIAQLKKEVADWKAATERWKKEEAAVWATLNNREDFWREKIEELKKGGWIMRVIVRTMLIVFNVVWLLLIVGLLPLPVAAVWKYGKAPENLWFMALGLALGGLQFIWPYFENDKWK